MNDPLINQLKRDGQELDRLAEKRLAQGVYVKPPWEKQSEKSSLHRSWLWAVAASVIFTAGLLYTSIHTNQRNSATNLQPVNQALIIMDEQMKKPLHNEQQAIIEDLKMLKDRFLSI